MKKLGKRLNATEETVEAYSNCSCTCGACNPTSQFESYYRTNGVSSQNYQP